MNDDFRFWVSLTILVVAMGGGLFASIVTKPAYGGLILMGGVVLQYVFLYFTKAR